jgi:hypothetical protein
MHRPSRPKLAMLAVGVLTLALGALAPIAANAASGAAALPVATSHTITDATPYCATKATPLGEATKTSTADSQCFGTRGEALAVAMGDAGYARLSDSQALALTAEGGALNKPLAENALAAQTATPLIGIDFTDWHYLGASNYIYNFPNGCQTGPYTINNEPLGWDESISSSILVATGGCSHHFLYDGPNRTFSAIIDCTYGNSDCYYVGDIMNDQTSSEIFF